MGKELGPSVVLTNRDIRKMLRLADANENDVFYDLGCGAGQLCIIAVKEFNVKRAVGIEKDIGRVKKAKENARFSGLHNKIVIRHESIEDANFKAATIVYCGLGEEEDSLEKYENTLQKGCRLITLDCPLVSVLPDKRDYPFYLMKFPFTKTQSADEWASAVLFKKATLEELDLELRRDREISWESFSDIRLLRKLARARFKTLD